MLSSLRAHLSYANVVSTICLFVVLGGGAYAASALPANSVGGEQLKRNAVRGPDIERGAVSSSDVEDRSLLAQDFALGQLPAGPRRVFVRDGNVDLAGVMYPARKTIPLGTVPGLGSFGLGGNVGEPAQGCELTFTNTSGGPVSIGMFTDPGIANGETFVLAGASVLRSGGSNQFVIGTPGMRRVLSGFAAVAFGSPGPQNEVCAGAVHVLVS